MVGQYAIKMPSCLTKNGEVPEWTIGAVSKTVVGLASTVGSNPTLSAEVIIAFGCARAVLFDSY
jgi:hypothetical protein